MEFRLATKLDLTPEICRTILHDAEHYIKENEAVKNVSFWEILNVFISFCDGRINDPQFWLAFKEDTLAGFMITQTVTENKHPALYIREAYIHPLQQGNGLASFCMDILDKKAKNGGAKYIICQRYSDAESFGHMMEKYGYKHKATEFIKEL